MKDVLPLIKTPRQQTGENQRLGSGVLLVGLASVFFFFLNFSDILFKIKIILTNNLYYNLKTCSKNSGIAVGP
jgi:hypothetical protein